MLSYPLVTFVIPFFNHGLFIDEAANSILNQLHQNMKLFL